MTGEYETPKHGAYTLCINELDWMKHINRASNPSDRLSLSEQLTSIAHVKRMFVSRGMDNRVVLAGLRQLQRELRMERRAGLAQTTIDQFFGGQQ